MGCRCRAARPWVVENEHRLFAIAAGLTTGRPFNIVGTPGCAPERTKALQVSLES